MAYHHKHLEVPICNRFLFHSYFVKKITLNLQYFHNRCKFFGQPILYPKGYGDPEEASNEPVPPGFSTDPTARNFAFYFGKVFNMHKQWEERTLHMARRQTVTLRHVAEAANVSIAAASRALSGNGYVNEETRQRVLDQARLLRYRIRGAARSLRSGKSGLIGLIIPNNKNVFFTGIAQRLEDIFYEHGYCLLKGSSRGEREREAEYVARMVSMELRA
jgi:hypothetical protein